MPERNESPLTKKEKIFSVLPPVILILSNIFLFGPFTIYLGNTKDLEISFISILQQFLIPALIFFIVLSFLALLLPKKFHKIFVSIIFALGLLTWIQGNILVWNYGLLNGQSIDWKVDQWRGWIDGGIWFLIIPSFIIFFKNIYKIVKHGSYTLIILQLALAVYLGIANLDILKTDFSGTGAPPQWASEFSPKKNVIQLILDGVQSDIFQDIIKEDSTYYTTVFEGFTFFNEATGHFQSTHLSVPAIASGKLYKNDIPMSQFYDETFNGKTTVNDLHEHGYDVDLIPWSYHVLSGEADHYYTIPSPYASTDFEYGQLKAALIADLVLFRDVPHFLKRFIYNDQKWFIQNVISHDERLQFRRFGDDAFLHKITNEMSANREKPVYKFYHLESSHPPFVTNKDCQYAGQVLSPTRENILIQIRCVLSSVVSFVEKLKSVGIYDNSLIIIQADHGYMAPVSVKEGNKLTEGYDLSPWVVSAAIPLLLVKPPASKGMMQTSSAPVMLMDIPATITSVMGIQDTFPGKSVYDVLPTEIRHRKFSYFQWSLFNWETDHLPPLDNYTITGNPFERSSWELSQPDSGKMSLSTKLVDLGSKEAGRFLGFGWSYREIDPQDASLTITWALGDSASIKLSLPKTQVRMTANVKSLFGVGNQTVTVKMNGKKIGEWKNTKWSEWEKQSIIIKADAKRPIVSHIVFVFSKCLKPTEEENRQLALMFESITFDEQ